jgi:hypothetical protein
VAAEHVLLLAKLALHYLMSDTPETDLLQAGVEREFKQKYMAGLGEGAALGPAARSADAGTAPPPQHGYSHGYQPQLSATYPSSGPLHGGTVVSVRGARFGQARRYGYGYTCYGYEILAMARLAMDYGYACYGYGYACYRYPCYGYTCYGARPGRISRRDHAGSAAA